MFKTTAKVTALLAATTLMLAGCSSGGTEEPVAEVGAPVEVPGADTAANEFMNELYQQALEAGKTDIVIYGPSVSTSQPMYDTFTTRFPGLKVVPQDAPDAETITKLQAEAQSGNRIADLFAGGGPTTAQVAAQPGICAKAEIETAPADFEVPYGNDGRLLPFAYRYFSFIYNTDEVSAEEAPKTWDDLLDPKWQGKLVMADPANPGGLRYLMAALVREESAAKWGQPYLEKFVQQDIVFGTSESAVPADVASGRGQIGVGVYSGYYAAQKAKGAPLEIVFPLEDDGNFFTRSSVCYIDNAPQADAALLYLNWLFTEEGQQSLAEDDGSYGLLPGSPGPLGAPPQNEVGALPISSNDPAFNEPLFAIVDSVFKP